MAACDLYWTDVELLVYGNSTAGSTSFVDSSPVGNVMSGGGTTVATAANTLFGQNTILIGNTYVTTPITGAGPLDLSTVTAWTIEGFIFPTSLTNERFLTAGDTNTTGFYLQMTSTGQVVGQLEGSTDASFNSGTSDASLNTWNHFALVRNGNMIQLYINGANSNAPVSITGFTYPSWSAGAFSIGGNEGLRFAGQMAEIRVTSGVARYTANFVPPNAQFADITCTPGVPNVVGDTLAQATATNAAAGYVTTVQEQNHPTLATGLVISQNPAAGTLSILGTNVILQISTGPTTTVYMGGDTWGSTGGGGISSQAPEPLGQALAYATQQNNAVVQGNQSVLATLATGAINSTSLAPTTQNTPATSVPTTPTMG
jgi:hypothetical protein